MRPRRVLGYARVSSEEQALGSSLQDQQDAIAAYAKGQGFKVARFYVESESAVHEKNERREQIRMLRADVRDGDLVVCAKLDRWSRDPEFTYRSVREILEAGGAFYFVDERIDPSTRDGDSALGFRILFAREEHKRIKERMVGTRRLLRDRGFYVEGTPPLGYRRAHPKGHKGQEKNVLVVVEEEAELVRRAFRMCASGRSVNAIASELGMLRDRVLDALRRRVYIGEMQDSRGTWIKGKHPAIVDADTFARAQAGLAARRLGGARTRGAPSETSTWILRDVAQCGQCGARMSAAYGGPHDERRYYYRCSKRCAGYVPVREVETEGEPLIVARLEELRDELGREPKKAHRAPATDLAERRARLVRRRAKYLEAFADELMTRDELRAAVTKLDAEALRLDAEEQAALRPDPLDDAKTRRAALREIRVIRRAWKRATPEERREIVRLLASVAAISKGEAPRFTWRSAEDLAGPA